MGKGREEETVIGKEKLWVLTYANDATSHSDRGKETERKMISRFERCEKKKYETKHRKAEGDGV